MTREDKENYLRVAGWGTWYSDDYWVHPKTVVDRSRQDYTNYGLSLDDAYTYEVENRPPWRANYMGLRIA